MIDLDARTRQIGAFPVYGENISPAQNAGLPENSGTGFFQKKRVPEFPLPSSPQADCGARETIRYVFILAVTKNAFKRINNFYFRSGKMAR